MSKRPYSTPTGLGYTRRYGGICPSVKSREFHVSGSALVKDRGGLFSQELLTTLLRNGGPHLLAAYWVGTTYCMILGTLYR